MVAPRERTEFVLRLLRRAEPALLVGVALHTVILVSGHDGPVALGVLAGASFLLGAAGLVIPGDHRTSLLRAVVAISLLLAVSLWADDRLSDLVSWHAILFTLYPLAFGLRRGWPLLVLMIGPFAWALGEVHGPWTLVLLVFPIVPAALVAGLISDVMVDAVAGLRHATTRERELRTAIDTAPIGILTVDVDGRTTLVNALITEFLHLHDAPPHIDDFLQYVHHSDLHVIDEIGAAIEAGVATNRVCRVIHPQLGERHIRIITAALTDSDGALEGAVITIQDIHDELDNRRKLEQFRTIADSTTDIIGVASLRPEADYLNPAGQRFFGAETIPLDRVQDFIPAEYHHLLFHDILEIIAGGGSWSGELELFDRDGERRPTSAVVMGLHDEAGQLEAFAVIYRDIEERKQLVSRLAFEAGHDILTTLPNRQQLFNTLTTTLEMNEAVTVLFCDLDGFKVVNDSLGHAVGDQLLCAVATRLGESARSGDLVGRLGGDEFVVVCRDALDAAEAERIAQRFIDIVRQPIVINGREHEVSMSVGIAMSSPGVTGSELVQRADLAMYAAKQAGRRRVALFDQEMRVRADRRLELEAAFRTAISNHELQLHYQPIVNIVSGELIGFEALARWMHPLQGTLRPKDFMQVADNAGYASAIGEFVVREAVHTGARMRLLAPHLAMSVNLSAAQLVDPRLPDVIATALTESELPASALTVEITEDIVMDELTAAQPRLDALRALGVRFAIDDFGTGYSNLTMLKQFPADYVKIDRSLVHGEPELMKLVLSLTRELGFAPIAEGVETVEQLTDLRTMGCHHAQGYFFAEPMTTAEAMAYLTPITKSVPER
jgi:diguanylate cyclase (GGDEF)-like protein/PAS domain S-box-containing protein